MNRPLNMNAIGLISSLPIEHPQSLELITAKIPKLSPHDVLVKVNATSLNPVDAKMRIRSAPENPLDTHKILGYDAVGLVAALGEEAKGYQIGDRVYYAGDITREGTNAEYQAVDYRIIAKAPQSLNDAAAAALPLTALTGWEALFDRLRVDSLARDKTLLIIGGAGGVGSITTQLAKKLTLLTVVTTASREESKNWSLKMGADAVVDHRHLVDSARAAGFTHFDYIFNTADTAGYWDDMAELIAPQGMICSIVETDKHIDLTKLQSKSAGFVWELMFTRSLFNTSDIQQQHTILETLSELVDSGEIKTTLTETIHGFSVNNFKKAHKKIESGTMIGKISIVY